MPPQRSTAISNQINNLINLLFLLNIFLLSNICKSFGHEKGENGTKDNYGNGYAYGNGGIGGKKTGRLIDGIDEKYYAPNPYSDYALHVQRRIMRFCTKYPTDKDCNSDWVLNNGLIPPNPLGVDIVGSKFPKPEKYKTVSVPVYEKVDVLVDVPTNLLKHLPKGLQKKLNDSDIEAMKRNCANGSCKTQKPEYLNNRAGLADILATLERLYYPDRALSDIDQNVETKMRRTFQVKEIMVTIAGIGDFVDPADNGLFANDLLLTEEQANVMINLLGFGQPLGTIILPSNSSSSFKRRKRAGDLLFFKVQPPSQKWPIGQPIPYSFDPSLSDTEKEIIQAAIDEIQSKTCVQFLQLAARPTSANSSSIYFIKYPQNQFCGVSYVGRILPVNPIFLSFLCPNMTGVAIHEILHALGVQHEHVRPDRDQSLAVIWANIDPQLLDLFAVSSASMFTTNGIFYDFGSVMHYASGIGAIQAGLQTMQALQDPAVNDPRMGQRAGLSATDVNAVWKLYCLPEACSDNNIYCGTWALNGLCSCGLNVNDVNCWMLENCPNSCDFCQCTSYAD